MTFEALQNAISRLIISRAEAHGNEADLKYTMLDQTNKNN